MPTPNAIPTPPDMTNFAGTIGKSVEVVVQTLSNTIGTILSSSGYLLVLILASLGFMFVAWAIRLIHLRGR